MFLYLPLFIIVLIVLFRSQRTHARLWNHYEDVFADHVYDVFRSEDALRHGHEFTGNESAARRVLDYACLPYGLSGIADEDAILLPILVDEKRDLLCFLRVGGEKERSMFKFVVHNMAAMKLHPSIYAATEASDPSTIQNNVRNSLQVMFRAEAFDSNIKPGSEYENDTAGHAHFSDILADLTTYSIKPFKDFYWSSADADEFYATHQGPPAFAYDAQRAQRWNELQNYFASHVEDTDVCKFKQIRKSALYQPGQFTVSLKDTVSIADSKLATACLAYVVAAFASDGAVNHIAITKPVELLNFRARSIQQSANASSALSASPYTQRGLRGGAQVISIADTGVDVKNCYFSDVQGSVPPTDITNPQYNNKYRKVIEYAYNGCGDSGDEVSGHGTHVSGTAVGAIAGANIENAGKYDGVAPDAKLVVVDLGQPGTGLCIPPAKELYTPGYNAGARVSTNSWGNPFNGAGYYNNQDDDLYLYKRPNSMIFFAAGNSGQNGDRTVTTQSTGKNSVSVGSSETTYGGPNITYVAFYSSKGPTYDGRIKPDLVAPGDSLESALSNGDSGNSCGTTTMTGTSMATPAAGGAALLFRGYFTSITDEFWTGVCNPAYAFCGSFAPSGMLIKALMIGSGSQMALYHGGGSKDVPLGPPPDFMQGFGRVTLKNVLPLTDIYNDRDLFVDDMRSLVAGQTATYTVSVSSSGAPLMASLAWYDAPNVGGTTNKALLHDLDLKATAPGGKVYFGNGKTTVDTLNANEKILVNNPLTGTWKVTVTAKALVYAPSQLYAVAINCRGKVKKWTDSGEVKPRKCGNAGNTV